MTTMWTGGQYSLVRAGLALGMIVVVGDSETFIGFKLAAVVLGAALAVGFRDRLAALGLAIVVAPQSLWASAALAVHAALPVAPYGSWDARRRPDPGGDWTMPDWATTLGWVAVWGLHLATAVHRTIVGGEWIVAAVEVGLLAAFTQADYRRWAWLALALLATADNAPFGLVFLHVFAFDPAWVAASTRIVPATVFYDGACGLCHRVVRFVLAEDRSGAFVFAPLGSAAFEQLVRPEDRAELPDSIVVRARDGELLVRAGATIEILMALGGLWRIAGTLATLLPLEVSDRAYDGLAARRRRLFAPPDPTCPLAPPALRARFLGDDLAERG